MMKRSAAIFVTWIIIGLILSGAGKNKRWSGMGDLARETLKIIDELDQLRKIAKNLPFEELPKEVIQALEEEEKVTTLEPKYLMDILPTDNKVIKRLKAKCFKFDRGVRDVAFIFDIPEPVFYGLIYHESGCDPKAKNPKSSARGLTQMIDATWDWSKGHVNKGFNLALRDRNIPDDSMMAGGWYLNHLFMVAERINGKEKMLSRKDLASWKIPLQYYYAGEGCGPKPKCRPEKKIYSKNIMFLANNLLQEGKV
jgi:hypothetical protein